MSENTSNGIVSVPVKTLWFEFLLQPKLLETHLNSDNVDPSPFELIIQFMTNASTTSPTLSIAPQVLSGIPLETVNGNGANEEEPPTTNILQQQLTQQLQQPIQKKDERDNKKSATIKLLAFKVAAHLKWDMELLEMHLPVTMQENLLSDLIKICDKNEAPSTCNLFACIWYHRWTIRCLLKSMFPTRGPKGPIIPFVLQQQIDPCYVSPESFDNLLKKLQEQVSVAISELEKMVCEKNKGITMVIAMPTFDCFNHTNGISYHWNKAVMLNTGDVIDEVLYDLGKWFFLNENYGKSCEYFEQISICNRDKFKMLDGYLNATRDLKSGASSETKDIDIIDLGQQIKECVDDLMKGRTCDISIFDSVVDVREISDTLNTAYKNYTTNQQKVILKRLIKYLVNRIKGLRDLIDKNLLYEKRDNENLSKHSGDIEMMEEGEIVAEEEVTKDPELLLLESSDPEQILNLVSKVKKHPLMINCNWNLPILQSKLLQNIPQQQYDKCHIILAKASQLRNAKMFIESRTLYLSLLEDVQASLPQLADVIRWELLRTDLENYFDTNDKDERKTMDLISKCTRTLMTIDQNLIIDSFELAEFCCVFLLETHPASLNEFINSQLAIIKLTAVLSILSLEQPSSSTAVLRGKEIWELLMSAFFINSVPNKKLAQVQSQSPLSITPSAILSFTLKLKDPIKVTIILSCLAKLHNVVRDYPSLELTIPSVYSNWWPSSIGSLSTSLDSNAISTTIGKLLNEVLIQRSTEITWLRLRAELSSIESNYAEALKYFTLSIMISTKYFTSFSLNYVEEDGIIHKMIHCCIKLGCHTQAAVLHQMTKEPNYALAFKALSERNCNDSCDDLYECIWDITMLEYLINVHFRRGEVERKTKAIQLIGQLELNASNTESVIKEAADIRRGKFLRIFSRTYL